MFHSSHSHSHTQNRTQPPQSLLHTRLHNHSKSSFCRQPPHTSLHTMASPQHDHLPSFLTVWFFFFLPLFSSLSLSLCINFVHQLCSTALLLNCFFYFYFFYMIKVMVLKILITLSSKNWNLTEIDWNWNTTKTDSFQPFRSVSVENFTNQNIWFRLAIHIQNRLNQTEHTSNPISKKYHILLSQKLLYLLYHTILQYIWLLNFYFTIQHIKIIYLHNKIIYLKIISNLLHFSSLSNFCLSSSVSLFLSLNNLAPPPGTTTDSNPDIRLKQNPITQTETQSQYPYKSQISNKTQNPNRLQQI